MNNRPCNNFISPVPLTEEWVSRKSLLALRRNRGNTEGTGYRSYRPTISWLLPAEQCGSPDKGTRELVRKIRVGIASRHIVL